MDKGSDDKKKNTKVNVQKEGSEEIDRFERIVDRADKEIERVHNTYRLLMGLLTIIFFFGIGAAAVVSWKTVGGMNDAINKNIIHINSRLDREIDILQRQVNSRIDEEFKREEIQKLIEDKASEYAEKETKKYIAEKVENAIDPFREEMKGFRRRADVMITSYKNLFEIYLLADIALNGSKDAYLKLKRIAQNKTDFSGNAQERLIQIQRSLEFYQQTPSLYKELFFIRDGEKNSFEKLSLDEIVNEMVKPALSHNNRATCMVYIKNMTKKEIFEKALTVFEESDSLYTCAAFCGVLSEISEEKVDFLDFEGWIEICEEHLKYFRLGEN